MSLDYGAILRRAWQITWNNKILWLFGILAGLVAGNSPNLGQRGPDINYRFDYQNPDLPPGLRRMVGDVDQNVVLAIIAGLACLALVIFIVVLVLGVIGRGGLIGGIRLADKQGKVSFGEAWAIGLRKFIVIFAIGLVVWIIGLLIAGASTLLAATICLAPLACIGFLLVAVLGVWTQLAQIAAVQDDLDIFAALTRAWQVIRDNLASVIVLGLILVVIGIIAGFVLAAPVVFIAVPAAIGFIFLASSDAAIAGNIGMIVGGLCLVIYVPIAIVVGGILQTWVTAAWTLAYEQMSMARPAAAAPVAPAIPPVS
jgi:hypothetical protein